MLVAVPSSRAFVAGLEGEARPGPAGTARLLITAKSCPGSCDWGSNNTVNGALGKTQSGSEQIPCTLITQELRNAWHPHLPKPFIKMPGAQASAFYGHLQVFGQRESSRSFP